MNWRHAHFSGKSLVPKGFVIYPQSRSIGSYAKGRQLLSKNFLLAGALVEAQNLSFWAVTPPNPEFERAQHGFAWLDDLAAVGDAKARHLAQQWVFDWVKIFGRGKGLGWQPGLTGRRLIHFCSNAEFLLHGLDEKNQQKLFKSLGKQVHYLTKRWQVSQSGLNRYEALTGLIYAGMALQGCSQYLQPALKAMGYECQNSIGKDGGIASRNPEELMRIFTLLTWVMKTLAENELATDDRISEAIQRIAPTLRGLRLGDGTLVQFHGGGRGMAGLLDQALADANVKERGTEKRMMGFERLSAGRLVLVADCAAPQPNSTTSHASTLGFEVSSGQRPMIVNCGAGAYFGDDWPRDCRRSAAHNVLIVDGKSSSKFADTDGAIFDGPELVTSNRASDLTGVWMVASHDGYAKDFGLTHERRLFISVDGRELSGEDKLRATSPHQKTQFERSVQNQPENALNFSVHFHIHPDIKASLDQDGHAVSLTLPNGEVWVFRQIGGLITLEDSVFLDDQHLKPRPTKQIIVSACAADFKGQITWNFLRAADGSRTPPNLVAETLSGQNN